MIKQKRTPELMAEVGRLRGTGMTVKQAAEALGLNYGTLRGWISIDKRSTRKNATKLDYDETISNFESKSDKVAKQIKAAKPGDKISISFKESIPGEGRVHQYNKKIGTVIHKDSNKLVVEIKPWERVTVTYNDLMSRYAQIGGSK